MERTPPIPVSAQLVESLTVGGGESLAVRLAGALADRGGRAYLYVLGGPGPLSARIDPAVEVRYLGLDRASVSRPWALAGSVVAGVRRLAAQIRQDGVQILQCHLPAGNFWGLALAEVRATRVIATVHSTREFDYGARDVAHKRHLRQLAYKRLLRRCAATVAVSRSVRDALLADLGLDAGRATQPIVIANGVDILPIAGPRARTAMRERYELQPDAPVVVAAGRLVPLKEFDVLLRAVAHLRDQGLVCGVVIAGEGESRADLEQLMTALDLVDRVRLPGICDLTELLPAADLFVLSSRYEGLPLTLLEAMGAGLPVIATELAGLQTVVADPDAGVLVPVGADQMLADAMAEFLHDSDRRLACGRRARQHIESHHSFATSVDQVVALYHDVLASAGPIR